MSSRHTAAGVIGVALALVVGLAASEAGVAGEATTRPPSPGVGPMTAAHRTSGVAPLSVFFDGVDTVPEGAASPFRWTSGVHQPADGDHEGLHYAWDFGDAGSGRWPTTGGGRNTATGYTAAHVYETPGTYQVRLEVTDKAGVVRAYQQAITVTEFRGATYYVSAQGSDAADGRTPATALRTAERGFAKVNGANRRLLFRRGDRFPMPRPAVLSAPGPGLVGAYGAGSRPVLESTVPEEGAIIVRGPDWRVMDLEISGPGTGNNGAIGFDVSRQTVDALFLRLAAPGWNVGIGWGDWTPILATPHDGVTVMECEVAGSRTNGMYVGGRRLALLGNDVHDMADSHVLRVWQAHKAVIAHNRLWNPGATRHAIKLHGGAFGGARPETRWVTISDNLIRGKTWSVAIGPQDGGVDERLSHVVFERNRFWGEASVQVDLEIWARQVMVRNNLFDGTGASRYYTAVAVGRRGVEPPPEEVRVLHNTVVRTDPSSEFEAFKVQPAAGGVLFRNNLASAPSAPRPVLVSGAGGPGFVSDHNLLVPLSAFTDAAGGDLTLGAGSPAVDGGRSAPEVRADYFGQARPRGAGVDLGAIESR
ncbi:MAG: PKD domain-containing protein [Anaeromyxobacter sp.]|nr:PKD domain-containing protein [Anaeromyxobacter sp.]